MDKNNISVKTGSLKKGDSSGIQTDKEFVKEFVKFYENMKYIPEMAVKIGLSKLYEKAYELEHPEEFRN
jgi:hypothetical protein